jgi:hypothetical protein
VVTVLQSGSLKLLETSGPVQASNGIALLGFTNYLLYLALQIYCFIWLKTFIALLGFTTS